MGKGTLSMALRRKENKDEEKDTNMAVWLTEANKLEMRPWKLRDMGTDDVEVRIKSVGICGSDVHYLKHMRCADFVVKEPMVIGHECAGVVEKVGPGVTHLKPGDRVALEAGVPCLTCRQCKQGSYNLCPDMKFFATPPVHGALANKVVHPANLCFKLPENVSYEEGAMCEPLSVAVHACKRASVGPETNMVILGAGAIGLVTLLVAKAFGVSRVVVTDVDESRLEVARSLGADECVKVGAEDEDDVERIMESMGRDVDVSIDCAGFTSTMTTAIKVTVPGGKVCLVGMGHNEMTLPIMDAAAREVDVLGVLRYKNTWPLCLDLISSGKVDVKPLITHRFAFSQTEVEEAFRTSSSSRNAIKVMINL